MDDTARRMNEAVRNRASDDATATAREATRGYVEEPFDPMADRGTGNVADRNPDAAAPADASGSDDDVTARTSQIREEIAQTRDEMSETIEAIQEKLRPGHIVANATDRVKQATTERVRSMAETASGTAGEMMDYTRDAYDTVAGQVRHNPIPIAMIGIGAAWLLMSRSKSSTSLRRFDAGWQSPSGYRGGYDANTYNQGNRYGASRSYYSEPGRGSEGLWRRGHREQQGEGVTERAQEFASNLGDRAQEYAGNVTERAQEYAGEFTDRAQQYAGEAYDTVQRRGRQAQNELQRMMSQNPLLVGAGALALGAIIGMALPETERENEWMGEARDQVIDRAQDMARDAATKVQSAAGDVVGEVASRVVSGDTH